MISKVKSSNSHAPSENDVHRRGFLRLIAAGAGSVAAGSSLLTACGGGSDTAGSFEQPATIGSTSCPASTYPIYVGRNSIVAGTMYVSNTDNHLIVQFQLSPEYNSCSKFGTIHLWAGWQLEVINGGGQSRPSPGQLPWHSDNSLYWNAGTLTWTIPKSELKGVPPTDICGKTLHVVAHAELCGETAFGGDIPGKEGGGNNAWWWRVEYSWCCEEPPPPPKEVCETAFAYGTHTLASNAPGDPPIYKSLDLTRNRWGWAIKFTNTNVGASATYAIYAGAGLNRTADKTPVGTLTIIRTLSGTKVTYTATQTNVSFHELHLYAGATPPTTIAPGRYGNTVYLDDSTYTFTIEGSPIWFIAHAVACWPQ